MFDLFVKRWDDTHRRRHRIILSYHEQRPHSATASDEIFIKYANEGENYFSYIIVIISTLASEPTWRVIASHILPFFWLITIAACPWSPSRLQDRTKYRRRSFICVVVVQVKQEDWTVNLRRQGRFLVNKNYPVWTESKFALCGVTILKTC